jgi:predicted DNA-binding WGR domain protein
MARFYRIALEPTLFGEISLVRNWGRIGTTGQAMMETFGKIGEADAARDRLERMKRRRGYLETA